VSNLLVRFRIAPVDVESAKNRQAKPYTIFGGLGINVKGRNAR
jgi:hypothetical protein